MAARPNLALDLLLREREPPGRLLRGRFRKLPFRGQQGMQEAPVGGRGNGRRRHPGRGPLPGRAAQVDPLPGDPGRHRQGQQEGGRPYHRFDPELLAENPQQPQRGCRQQEPHQLLEALHPGAWPRQEAEPARLGGEQDVGKRHSQSGHQEDPHGDAGALAEREPEGGAEEGGGAWSRQDRREDAVEEAAGEPLPVGQPPEVPLPHGDPHCYQAEKAQAQQKHEGAQEDDERRRLELEPPADLLPPGFQQQNRGGESEEGRHHSRGERQPELPGAGARFAGLRHEPQDLEGNHREDAGHQVEDQSADEGEEQVRRQGARFGGVRAGEFHRGQAGAAAGVEIEGDRPVAGPRVPGLLVKYHPGQLSGLFLSLGVQAQLQVHLRGGGIQAARGGIEQEALPLDRVEIRGVSVNCDTPSPRGDGQGDPLPSLRRL